MKLCSFQDTTTVQPCLSPWHEESGYCLFAVPTFGSYNEAVTECSNAGGSLVTIKTQSKQQAVTAYVTTIGASE